MMRKLNKTEQIIAAMVMNAMIKSTGREAKDNVTGAMLHPCNGQFDANPGEAARSFIRAFANKHKITGVVGAEHML